MVQKGNCLDIRLEFDGRLYIQLYDKRDHFDFPAVNFRDFSRIFRNPLHMVFLFTVDRLYSGLFEI